MIPISNNVFFFNTRVIAIKFTQKLKVNVKPEAILDPSIGDKLTGWWFGTWVLFFHRLGINHPNSLSYFSEGQVDHQPATGKIKIQRVWCEMHMDPPWSAWSNHPPRCREVELGSWGCPGWWKIPEKWRFFRMFHCHDWLSERRTCGFLIMHPTVLYTGQSTQLQVMFLRNNPVGLVGYIPIMVYRMYVHIWTRLPTGMHPELLHRTSEIFR